MNIDLSKICCFGVAGNFTGHLEQAGEAESFKNVVTKTQDEPKAVFPTYIPASSPEIPEFLNVFPFSSEKISYPPESEEEQNLQIESECAVIFDVSWENGKICSLKPVCFGASNDCSIRRKGKCKISWKKNWGKNTKGFSSNAIEIDRFSSAGNISRYRIKSFLVRAFRQVFEYGEDSRISDYSYIYDRLTEWLINKINTQEDFESAENIRLYLEKSGFPEKIMVSIGATRYTDFGKENFLQKGDEAVVVLYPEDKYKGEEITEFVQNADYSKTDISFLVQKIV